LRASLVLLDNMDIDLQTSGRWQEEKIQYHR